MPRLLFEKTGDAIWISHLDLMRLFQRAFKRAGLPLKHTQGFNPRPSVSIALPLSVGVQSRCELLDFELDGAHADCQSIMAALNKTLPAGIKVLEAYDSGRKLRDLVFLRCCLVLEYDNGVPQNAVAEIEALFQRDSLVVQKKTKSGLQDQDIIPMIRFLQVKQETAREIYLEAVICCQNPTLNPAQITLAISNYLPALAPDFSKCSRIEIYDHDETVFR